MQNLLYHVKLIKAKISSLYLDVITNNTINILGNNSLLWFNIGPLI